MKSNRSNVLLSVPLPCSLIARGQWIVLLLLTRTHRALVKPPSTDTAGQKEKGCYFKPVPLSLPNNSVRGSKNPAGSSKARISPLVPSSHPAVPQCSELGIHSSDIYCLFYVRCSSQSQGKILFWGLELASVSCHSRDSYFSCIGTELIMNLIDML